MTRDEFLKLLPELASDYKPAPDVLKQISQLTLLMVIGASGVGKTSLINQLGIKFVPSHTTRAPRFGERDGEDFYFLNDYSDTVKQVKEGAFVQMVVGVSGDLYATKASSYPPSGLAVMPVLSDVVPFFRRLGFKDTISVFITPPSYEEWMKRLSSHELNQEQRAKRLAEARRSFEFALSDKETHFVLNDDLEKAVGQARGIANGQIDEVREQKAKKSAQEILSAIK
jgi:guanylate kinase